MVFNKIISIRNRISFKNRNVFFNYITTSNITIRKTFTKRNKIKESRKIYYIVLSYRTNIIKHILTLFTFIIYIFLIKFFNKLFRIRHTILRIYSIRILTLLLCLLNSLLISFFKFLLKSLLS